MLNLGSLQSNLPCAPAGVATLGCGWLSLAAPCSLLLSALSLLGSLPRDPDAGRCGPPGLPLRQSLPRPPD